MALIPTDLAVWWLADQFKSYGIELSERIIRQRLYDWSRRGEIRNHGRQGKGRALWNLWELESKVEGWAEACQEVLHDAT